MSNKFYEKHSEWLIPVLCLVVIFQAVFLFGNSAVRETVDSVTRSVAGGINTVPTQESAVAQIQMVPSLSTVKEGGMVGVEVWLKPNRAIVVGGMDLVLSFDTEFAGVTKVTPGKTFSLVIPNRQSEKNGRLFVTYLDETGDGVEINEEIKLLDLVLTTKQAGDLVLRVVSSVNGATTVLAEKSSNLNLPFTASDLVINVTNN